MVSTYLLSIFLSEWKKHAWKKTFYMIKKKISANKKWSKKGCDSSWNLKITYVNHITREEKRVSSFMFGTRFSFKLKRSKLMYERTRERKINRFNFTRGDCCLCNFFLFSSRLQSIIMTMNIRENWVRHVDYFT